MCHRISRPSVSMAATRSGDRSMVLVCRLCGKVSLLRTTDGAVVSEKRAIWHSRGATLPHPATSSLVCSEDHRTRPPGLTVERQLLVDQLIGSPVASPGRDSLRDGPDRLPVLQLRRLDLHHWRGGPVSAGRVSQGSPRALGSGESSSVLGLVLPLQAIPIMVRNTSIFSIDESQNSRFRLGHYE